MELTLRFKNPDQSGAGDNETVYVQTTFDALEDTTAEDIQEILEDALIPIIDGGIKPLWSILSTPD